MVRNWHLRSPIASGANRRILPKQTMLETDPVPWGLPTCIPGHQAWPSLPDSVTMCPSPVVQLLAIFCNHCPSLIFLPFISCSLVTASNPTSSPSKTVFPDTGGRCAAFEHAEARICRETAANVLVRGLTTLSPQHHHCSVEVIANSLLPLWNGAWLAVDTTNPNDTSMPASCAWPRSQRSIELWDTYVRLLLDFQLVGLNSGRGRDPPPPSQPHRHQQQWPCSGFSDLLDQALNPPSPTAVCPRGKAQHRPRTNSRKKARKKNEKTLWEKIARERIVMKGTARGRDERLPAEDLYVEELGVKERRARVLCATCTRGARQDHGRWFLATFRFGSTSKCRHRLRGTSRKRTVCNSGGREAGVELWEGIHPGRRESTQDAVLQGKQQWLPSWQGGRGVGGAGQGIAGLTGYGRGRKFGWVRQGIIIDPLPGFSHCWRWMRVSLARNLAPRPCHTQFCHVSCTTFSRTTLSHTIFLHFLTYDILTHSFVTYIFFNTTHPPQSPLSFLPSPYCFGHCVWFLEEVALWWFLFF